MWPIAICLLDTNGSKLRYMDHQDGGWHLFAGEIQSLCLSNAVCMKVTSFS